MSAIENILSMVVLVGMFLAAFMIITGMNVKFFTDVVDYSIDEYSKEKYGGDLDAILNTTEPVSKDSYAGLLADAVYYRKKNFEYKEAPEITLERQSNSDINRDISFYYNDSLAPDTNRLQVDKLMQLTFEKLYGKDNFYLEITPLIVKLRLYFVIDGSLSLENETAELKQAIPNLIKDFNSEFDVFARVLVLADGGLDKLDPCKDLKEYAACSYLHKEELYTNQVSNGWLTTTQTSTEALDHLLSNSSHLGIGNNPSFNAKWTLSSDEFLDETDSNQQKAVFFCSWVDLNKDSLSDFKMQLNFANSGDKAGVRINKTWHDAQKDANINVINDLNSESKWQTICVGYRPSGAVTDVSYKYIMTPAGGQPTEGFFKQKELFAFRTRPKDFNFFKGMQSIDLNYNGGVYYEDWASASVYAAVTAEKENPSTLTVIIPISDELSLGSESERCESLSGFAKVFCERCNKLKPTDTVALDCPVGRSSKDVNRAIGMIQPFGYSVFPVLANSCDIASPYNDESNLTCATLPQYSACLTNDPPICGQCFGPAMECPGLTLENDSSCTISGCPFGIKGCDKKHCRPFIEEQMNQLAEETGGKMIRLTEIQKLHEEISNAITETIEKYKIKAGIKKPEEERFVYKKLVPLSNRLFADLQFWHYKNAKPA